jgi:hypothetical protein
LGLETNFALFAPKGHVVVGSYANEKQKWCDRSRTGTLSRGTARKQVVEKMAVTPPPPEAKLALLEEIAAEYNVPWDSAQATNRILGESSSAYLVRHDE